MKEILANELTSNFFDEFKNKWALVVVKDSKEDNAMTIAWGGVGIIWSKQVCSVYVKNLRYTKHMLDEAEYFSVSFFDDSYKDVLAYLGRVSRKDEDKITNSKLTRDYVDGVLVLKEARLTLIMKKIYQVDLPVDKVNDPTILKYYTDNGMHTQYIGEIVKVLIK